MSDLSIIIPKDLKSNLSRDTHTIIDLMDLRAAIEAISLILEADSMRSTIDLTHENREGLYVGIRFLSEAMKSKISDINEDLSSLDAYFDNEEVSDGN